MLLEVVQREYVSIFHTDDYWADSNPEYLRGNTTSNECEELFTKYKKCLNVSLVYMVSVDVLLRLTAEFLGI